MTHQIGSIIKNKTYTTTIHDLGTKGEGIGKIDGITLFVKEALPGDEIEVKILMIKKNFVIGKLIKIMTPSPLRQTPKCSVTARCGGCQIQQMAYPHQLEFKTKKLTDSLERIGKVQANEILPIIGMETPYFYRNKIQFAVGKRPDPQVSDTEEPPTNRRIFCIVGLYSINTHNIVNIHECHIQHPKASALLSQFKKYLAHSQPSIYDERTHTGLIRHILIRTSFSTQESMLCVILNGDELPDCEKLVSYLQDVKGFSSFCINTNTDPGDTVLGDKTRVVWGKPYLIETIADIQFAVSPNSFFQVNPIQTQKMLEFVKTAANLTGKECVWDAYCGIGTFALFLAKHAQKIIGVEVVPQAIADAKTSAALNGISNINWIEDTCETAFETLIQDPSNHPDVVILDPPRKGADERLLAVLTKIAPRKIIYVSCNPDTLARDLAYLTQNGFALQTIQPIDMFPHTVHIETVSVLTHY